jgi:hypothetical protein
MTGMPHIACWRESMPTSYSIIRFETLCDHVLRSAEIVIAAGTIAERAVARGVAPDRISYGGQFVVPEHRFTRRGLRSTSRH